MLNLEKYISSGIVESYVLGLTDEKETSEFEQLLPAYPQLKTAMRSFEYRLETTLLTYAAAPPLHVRVRLQIRIGSQEPERGSHRLLS